MTPDQLKGDSELTRLVIAKAKQIADKRWQELKNKKREDVIEIEGESDKEFEQEDTTMPTSCVFIIFVLYLSFFFQ